MKRREKPRYSLWSNVIYALNGVREIDPPLLGWMLLHAVMAALGSMVPVVFPKLIIDELSGGGSVTRVIVLSALFGAGIMITRGITDMAYGAPPIPLGTIAKHFMAWRMYFNLKQTKKTMTTDFQNIENPEVLDMSQKASRAMGSVNVGIEGLARLVLTMLGHLLTLIMTVSAVFVMGYWVLAVALVVLTVNYLISVRIRRRDKEKDDELTATSRRIDDLTNKTSSFEYGKDIRLFNLKGFLLSRLTTEQAFYFRERNKIQKLWLGAGLLGSVTTLAQEIVMYAWLCWRVLSNALSIGSFVMYIAAIRTFCSALSGLLDDYADMQQQSRRVSDLRAYLDLPDALSGGEAPPRSIDTEGAAIEFEKVSFRYPGSDQYALREVSLRIEPHERLAVVGLNGAGKSTFIKLLMRLYTPESGRILLGGIDIRAYARDEYFKLFSAVFQEINVFAFTVAENISMQELDKTDLSGVRRSAELAGLDKKLDSLKAGLNTTMLKIIDVNGVEFSGGETQKLALARALYKNAPFIVLDEPTAALDALAEERLYMEFDRLASGKTAVYISHRLASTRFCDRVLMFENGTIAESGTHDALLAQGAKYAELFNVQAQYYRDKKEEEATV